MTVTAEYYSENWGGWADSDELTAALRRAEIIVDREIFPSGYTASTVPEVLRTAAQKQRPQTLRGSNRQSGSREE